MKTKIGEVKLGTVFNYDKEEWEKWKNKEVSEFKKLSRCSSQVGRWERNFVGNMFVAVLWQAEINVIESNDEMLSMNISHPGKKRRCGWGKYVNVYYAYTKYEERRKGYATTLQRFLEGKWRNDGLDRLKSLVCSYGGFRFHRNLGHTFWGLSDKYELIVDAPIMNWDNNKCRKDFPNEGIPRHARVAVEKLTTPMTNMQLVSYLNDERCPYFYSIPQGEPETLYKLK